jgi:hypothetical protein
MPALAALLIVAGVRTIDLVEAGRSRLTVIADRHRRDVPLDPDADQVAVAIGATCRRSSTSMILDRHLDASSSHAPMG